jgi:hypothetical protein
MHSIFAPLIKAGDWATLIAMLDPSDPEDEAIRAMIEVTLGQQKAQAEKQQKMLEIELRKVQSKAGNLRVLLKL